MPSLLRSAVTVPLIDMVALSVALSVAQAVRPGPDVVILASPAVRMAGVYDRACAQAGVTARYGEDEAALLALIRRIKAEGATGATRRDFALLSAQAGGAVQIVACTEFSLVAGAAPPGVVLVDALDVLARAVVEFSLGHDLGEP